MKYKLNDDEINLLWDALDLLENDHIECTENPNKELIAKLREKLSKK